MRSAKKYLVGFSTAALVLGTVATGASVSAASAASSLPFSDIQGLSQAAAITFLAQAGIVNGVGGGQYNPSAPVTREQFAKIVVNLIGQGNVASALQNVTPSFTDAASIDTWAWGYVNVAQDMGIIKGYPDGSFKPLAPVSDVEAAAMLIRAIGDDIPGVVNGTWPGNYVAAAFNLGLANGVNFVATLPASRADIAQMAYNAAVNAPVYTATTTTTNGVTQTTLSKGSPLYVSGAVNGYKVLSGTVTGVSASNITIGSTTKNWENNYQIVGLNASNLNALVGIAVNALVDPAGNVAFVTLQSGQSATPNSGTLADANTPVPSGYYQFSNYHWLVSNNYNCANGGDPSASACAGNLYILLGGSSPTTVQLEAYNSPGTTFAINAPSTGLNSDTNASVPDVTYLNKTGAADDDQVTYVLDQNNKISVLYDTHVTYSAALVTSTICPSGCDNTPANPAAPQNQIQINGNTWITLQSWTQLTLNGASATLSKSLDNSVAYVNVVGNGFNGDNNAAQIALYQNTVTGTVTSVTTSNGSVTSFTVQPANGAAQTLSTDSNFSGSVTVGSTVTVALDSAGKARAIISTNASTTPVVALVTATGQTTTLSGVTNTVTANDNAGNNQTLNLYAPYSGTVYNSTYYTGGNNNNGLVLFAVNGFGYAVAPETATCTNQGGNNCNPPDALAPYTTGIPNGDTLKVYSTTSSSAVIGIYNSSGNLDYAGTNGNPFISVVNGDAFRQSDGSRIGFGGLKTGKTVGLWYYPLTVNNVTTTYFAVISNQ